MASHDDTYLELARQVPRPTRPQIIAFAHHVADDHSWYKRLPFDGLGEPFFLFIDPHVHMVRVVTVTGVDAMRNLVERPSDTLWPHIEVEHVADDLPGDFHVGQELRTTQEHRDRFGRWSYWNWGPPDQPRQDALASAARELRLLDEGGRPISVPAEILDLGLVHLRATVSPLLLPGDEDRLAAEASAGRPGHEEQRHEQLEAMIRAMTAIAGVIYG